MTNRLPDPDTYAADALGWLAGQVRPRPATGDTAIIWGTGSFDVAVFHSKPDDAVARLLDNAMAWQRTKFDAGYGAITWPQEYGGAGLPPLYEQIFVRQEAKFETPAGHETFGVTVRLIAPTIRAFGTAEQRERFIRPFLRTEELCCQLFSEPEAGSDLASLRTRAVRDGDDWIITGQKVWSSGAQFSRWGEIICRTDANVPKHKGLTVFIIPMDAPGIEIRPIRQMSGGAAFNEVFLNEVRISDSLRLGDVGDGWSVTLRTLGFERSSSGRQDGRTGGSWNQVLALARSTGRTHEVLVRQQLAELYTLDRIRQLNAARVLAQSGNGHAPTGSIGKLQWAQWLAKVSDVVSSLLGPRLVADSGEWGTYAWSEHVLGAPGYRIAGGSDEIQRNIIGERVLGLPR
jgi:alkylation response protein AidB-like acyl-CoA dehydrogenase